MTIEHRELEVAHYNARSSSVQGSGFPDALLVESRVSAELTPPATCPSFYSNSGLVVRRNGLGSLEKPQSGRSAAVDGHDIHLYLL